MSTKRKSGGKAPPDFKRLKAKVGKRTPKSVNETNTSFKAAALHVAGQSIDRSSGSRVLLSSGRGKSIFDLSAQLRHPAVAVRLSAIKGLGDIVRNQSAYMLRPHLSILVPTCAKSWVDEDDEVRTVGLSVFGSLLEKQTDSSIRPFILLIVSYFSSALHSLDPQMRVDGARAVNLVSSLHPRLLEPFVSKLLRPFVGLLTDRNKLNSNEEILRGLASLLGLSVDTARSHHTSEATVDDDSDLSFVSGGRARNTILLESRASRHPVTPFFSVQGLASFDNFQDSDIQYPPRAAVGEGADSELAVIYDIMEKLREILVEETEEENGDCSIGRKTTTAHRKEKLLLSVFNPIELVWRRKNRICSTGQYSDTEKLDKLAMHVVFILLDLFPIRQGDYKSIQHEAAENLNSAVCTTVMEIASSMPRNRCCDSEGAPLDWMVQLSSFLKPRLIQYKTNPNLSPSVLNVFCDLLLLSKTDLPETHRLSMLQQLQTVFFDKEDDEMARSPAGRKAVLALVRLMNQQHYGIENGPPSLPDTIKAILFKIPPYLVAWNADFDFETNQSLEMLLDIVRSNFAESDLVQHFREGMTPIVLVFREKTGKSKQSTFELYPLSTQRKFLSLLVMLEKPSNETLKGLASICAKSTSCAAMSDEIVSSIAVIRRTIPMKSYLQFLMGLIGTPTTKRRRKIQEEVESFHDFMERMRSLDSRVKRVSRALLQCGSARVLPMLSLHLSDLLDSNAADAGFDDFLRIRVAHSIFAMLALDMKNTTTVFAIPAQLDQILKSSIFHAIVFLSSSGDAMTEVAKLLSPILALFQVDGMLITSLFDHVVDKTSTYKSRPQVQNNLIQLLIAIVSDPAIAETMTGVGQLLCCVQSLELCPSKDEPGRSCAKSLGHLKALLEVKIGSETTG
eukprot:scaffold91_cov127-Cylindrotheca_fusiformis.AAC.4